MLFLKFGKSNSVLAENDTSFQLERLMELLQLDEQYRSAIIIISIAIRQYVNNITTVSASTLRFDTGIDF